MDERQKLLSEIMRSKRNELALTQDQAAERLKVSAKWYQKVESGKSKPGFDLLCDLANYFDIDFSQFPDKEEKTL